MQCLERDLHESTQRFSDMLLSSIFYIAFEVLMLYYRTKIRSGFLLPWPTCSFYANPYLQEIIKAAEEVLGEQRAIERQHQYEEAVS